MKLLFKQKMFSWFDSYMIYDEAGNAIFEVKGQLSWGHCLHIHDQQGNFVGMIKEKVLSFLPKFEMYVDNKYVGEIKKELTFLRPRFTLQYQNWEVQGDIMEWNYTVVDGSRVVAHAEKKLFNLTDTYEIDVKREEDVLYSLMIVLAIDAAKCSESKS